jgi:hypothetical protein
MRAPGFPSTKGRAMLSGSELTLQAKSFSSNAPQIRCRIAAEQFKKEDHQILDALPSGVRPRKTETCSKECEGVICVVSALSRHERDTRTH